MDLILVVLGTAFGVGLCLFLGFKFAKAQMAPVTAAVSAGVAVDVDKLKADIVAQVDKHLGPSATVAPTGPSSTVVTAKA